MNMITDKINTDIKSYNYYNQNRLFLEHAISENLALLFNMWSDGQQFEIQILADSPKMSRLYSKTCLKKHMQQLLCSYSTDIHLELVSRYDIRLSSIPV